MSTPTPPKEGESSSEPASPVKAAMREPPTLTVISRSRLDLSNYPCIPESRHLRLVMCRPSTSIRLIRFNLLRLEIPHDVFLADYADDTM
ncbi:hypothetical protein J6590_084647 [Homalodisca vitripennis]|nr:hypothetical protein J6590_084647 [Homalodisca vitripennis]